MFGPFEPCEDLGATFVGRTLLALHGLSAPLCRAAAEAARRRGGKFGEGSGQWVFMTIGVMFVFFKMDRYGSRFNHKGTEVLVLGSIYQVPFWVPIFDPQPDGTGLDGFYSMYQGRLLLPKGHLCSEPLKPGMTYQSVLKQPWKEAESA